MPIKYRKYNIVFQNVDPEKAGSIVEAYAKKYKEYVMSVEPNPQGDGFHTHLSVEYFNQRSKHSVLKELEKLKKSFILPRPQGEERDWGRVQVDPMYGTFQQNRNYLLGETKDKPIGEVKGAKKLPGPIIQRMVAHAVHRFYEGEVHEMPDMVDVYDEEYGNGFSEWCYERWYDMYTGQKKSQAIV